ncbi:hypothetical protein ACO3UB_03865 [Methanocaldococcus sp. 16A]
MKKLLLLFILLFISVSYALPIDPVIFVNKSTVDYENAKVLMDNLYSSREIKVNGSNITVIIDDIIYIPATDELEIEDNSKKLNIKFIRDNNGIKYKDIEYIEYLNLEKGKEISLFNKSYIVEDITSDCIILKEKDGKEITTNESFEYGRYKVAVKLLSPDLNTIVVDIYKNGKPIMEYFKLNKGQFYYVEGEQLGIIYKNCTKKGKSYYFTFNVYSTIEIKKDKDFPLDKNFIVKDLSADRIELVYKNINDLGNEIHLFNCTIILEKDYKDYVLFKVIKKETKTFNIENKTVLYLGEGFYAIKINNTVHVYYKGKELENHEKIYINSLDIIDIDPLNINKDIILIGGPKVNKFVKELENKALLRINITDNYPGNNIGVIQKIKNPYNNNNIYILAGSNRYGTKAAILAFLTIYNNESIMKVKLDNGHIKVLEKE